MMSIAKGYPEATVLRYSLVVFAVSFPSVFNTMSTIGVVVLDYNIAKAS